MSYIIFGGAINRNNIFWLFLLLFLYPLLVVVDGTTKDYSNRCNRMQPSKIKMSYISQQYYNALQHTDCLHVTNIQYTTATIKTKYGMIPHAKVQILIETKTKLHGLSPRPNYTDRATAACRRSDCELLRIKGSMWSAWWIPTAVFSVF
jgi:hypothetical protein